MKKTKIFKIELKKLNGSKCFDIPGECNESKGLSCITINSVKTCSYEKLEFYLFITKYESYLFILYIFRCNSTQYYDVMTSQCSNLIIFNSLIFFFSYSSLLPLSFS